MIDLKDYIIEGLRWKTAKDVDKKFEDFITNYVRTSKLSCGKPKTLVVYPDGIGIHEKDFKNNYGEPPTMCLELCDKNSNKLETVPAEFYKHISKEFLEKIDIEIEVPNSVITDGRDLDKICKELPKVDCIRIKNGVLISAKGNKEHKYSWGETAPMYSVNEIESFFKAHKGTTISGSATIVDIPGWDPEVTEICKKIVALKKKYDVGESNFVTAGQSYRQCDVPKEYR